MAFRLTREIGMQPAFVSRTLSSAIPRTTSRYQENSDGSGTDQFTLGPAQGWIKNSVNCIAAFYYLHRLYFSSVSGHRPGQSVLLADKQIPADRSMLRSAGYQTRGQ